MYGEWIYTHTDKNKHSRWITHTQTLHTIQSVYLYILFPSNKTIYVYGERIYVHILAKTHTIHRNGERFKKLQRR